MTTEYLQTIHSFLQKAGEIALSGQEKIHRELKADDTLVTETDFAVSALAHEHLKPYLSQPGHLLLDEESIAEVGTPAEAFARSEYQWILDPIDGTQHYASGLDSFGTMLALLHNGNPVAAGIVLPAKRVMLLADATGVYRQNEKGELEPFRPRVAPPVGQQSMAHVSGQRWVALYLREKKQSWVLSGDTAAAQFSTVVSGKVSMAFGSGTLRLWDFAAGMTIAHFLDMGMAWVDRAEPIFPIKPEYLADNWRILPLYLLCAKPDLSHARNVITTALEATKGMSL